MSSLSTLSLLSAVVVVLSQSRLVHAFTQCYYPDGSIPSDYIWEPCVGTGTGAKYSSCCVPSEGDICQDNGLCYYPSGSDTFGGLYRGACTDRTWNDPACNANVCVTGFETTWMWISKCDAGGSEASICGTMSESAHVRPTCASGAVTNTASARTTSTTTSAGRYTAPPSIDPALYSVYTSTYTTEITARAQTTTLTSTFQSTFTSTIGKAAVTGTTGTGTASAGTTSSGAATNTDTPKKNGVTLSTGALVAVVVGPLLAIGISVAAILLFLRRKRASQKGESIRLNSAGGGGVHPPPNGPVGADQVHPYEVDITEASRPPKREMYGYKSPKVESHEIDDRTATMRSDHNGRSEKLAGEKWHGATEMGVQGHETVTTPSPAYQESTMPSHAFEMDGTSSPQTGGRR